MVVKIEKYGAAWNLEIKRGQIVIFSEDGKKKKIDFTNATEFGAVLTLLSSSRNAVIHNDGTIASGREVIEE